MTVFDIYRLEYRRLNQFRIDVSVRKSGAHGRHNTVYSLLSIAIGRPFLHSSEEAPTWA
jgi:hypothetical protein